MTTDTVEKELMGWRQLAGGGSKGRQTKATRFNTQMKLEILLNNHHRVNHLQ